MRSIVLAALVLTVATVSVRADVLDPDSKSVSILQTLAEPLDRLGVDVLYSHDSDAGRTSPSFGDTPRLAPLLGFKAAPGIAVDLDRHAEWLNAFESGARGAIAAVATEAAETRPTRDAFKKIWRGAGDAERIVITFSSADLEVAQHAAAVLETKGYVVYLAIADPEAEPLDPRALGRMLVQADQWLAIDSASARLNPIIQFEADLLAELKRQDAWVAHGEGLPPVKRGSMDVIESLGMLSMKVVPGGIVLGKKPVLHEDLKGAKLATDGSDYGIAVGRTRFVLEQVSEETRKAIRAFVATADSHSVVDIADSSVTLCTPFQETRIGERMVNADEMPFDHLSISGAQKSLIVDEAIHIRPKGDDGVAIDVTLEVRFYRRDDDGHADRLAQVRFTVEDALGSARLLDLTWSRRPGLRIGFDGAAIDELTEDLEQLALDAALIGLGRL